MKAAARMNALPRTGQGVRNLDELDAPTKRNRRRDRCDHATTETSADLGGAAITRCAACKVDVDALAGA